MSSAFFTLDIARKALTVSQKAIDVTGHNIANADTAGYTRQRLITAAVEPQSGISRLAVTERGQSGGGVVPITVDQVRSPFLDRQYWREHATESELSQRSETLGYVEGLFNELAANGLSQSIAEFSASVQEAAKNPVNPAFRTNLLQNALKLTETFQHRSTQLLDKQADLDHAIAVQISQINDMASSIADYNSQIVRYELNGQRANDLRDKRNALLDALSGLAHFQTAETAAGTLQIRLGDRLLVDHGTSFQLATSRTTVNPITGEADSLLTIAWSSDGHQLELTAGQLKALVDLRDGSSPDQPGLPFLHLELDRLAAGLATAFNDLHIDGYGLPNPDSVTGLDFFVGAGGKPLGAATFRVNPAIVSDNRLIALAGSPVSGAAQMGDNQNALRLGALFSSSTIDGIGSISGYLGSFVSNLAIEAANANKRLDGQRTLVASIDAQRQSVSGVSMDEEMTQLIRFEKSYAAAARLISAIDEMLDILINRTGIVGR
jgi:flagellar hook-associated protein 1 FlgK